MDFTTDSPSAILSGLTYTREDIAEALRNAASLLDTTAVRKYADQLDEHRAIILEAHRSLTERAKLLHRQTQDWRNTPEGSDAAKQLKEIKTVLLRLVML